MPSSPSASIMAAPCAPSAEGSSSASDAVSQPDPSSSVSPLRVAASACSTCASKHVVETSSGVCSCSLYGARVFPKNNPQHVSRLFVHGSDQRRHWFGRRLRVARYIYAMAVLGGSYGLRRPAVILCCSSHRRYMTLQLDRADREITARVR